MSYWRAARHSWQMMNPWRPMVRDHRGRKFPLYRFDSSWRYLGGTPDLTAERFARVRARLIRITRRGMGGPPALMLCFVLFYAAFGLWNLRRGAAWGVVWPNAVLMGMFLLSAITYRYRVPKADRDLVVDAMLSEGLCASCAYDLSSAAPDDHALVTCPECGAAWIIPLEESVSKTASPAPASAPPAAAGSPPTPGR